MRRRFLVSLPLITLICLAFVARVAEAREGVNVAIEKPARLVDQGQAVDLKVRVSCPVGREVLEAFAYVVQNQSQSQFGSIPVRCDGRVGHHVVRVPAFPDAPPFQPGPAVATGFVLVLDPATGQTESAQDNQRIRIR
jgi:hypothetical protein